MLQRILLFVFVFSVLAADGTAQDTLRILSWNTERGSNPYGPDGKQRVLQTIRDSGADVVLWQESYQLAGTEQTLGAWVAEQLGWHHWQHESPHLAVVSRWPFVDTFFHHPWHGVGARIRDSRAREFVVWSVWLDHRASVQWAALEDPPPTDLELLACETDKSDRFGQAQRLLDYLDELGHLTLEIPLVVGGDWNCPSDLDWTEATGVPTKYRRALPLPVSRLVRGAGFMDTYRTVHPDPLTEPGNTWTPMWDVDPETGQADPPERIDRIYLRNGAAPQRLHPMRAETLPRDWNDARLPRETSPFPSDHAAVLIEFAWQDSGSIDLESLADDDRAASPALDHRPPAAIEDDFILTRLAFGSCYQERLPCPVLERAATLQPQLYLALGDNIYGDTRNMDVLKRKYRRLGRQPAWRDLVSVSRVMAIWDDHDYGENDAGREYPHREESKQVFLDFFDEPADSPRRQRAGNYMSSLLGPPERRVQIILLDVRTFRSPLANERPPYPEIGDYRPLRDDEEQTMLGDEQWRWLEEQLRQPARIRLFGMSTQFGTGHNGYEAWANMPRERERLLELILSTSAEGVFFLSGDTHWAETSLVDRRGLYPIYDLTSSGVNQGWSHTGGNPLRIGPAFNEPNVGLIDIDWERDDPLIRARVLDVHLNERIAHEISLSDLTFAAWERPRTPISLDDGAWQTPFGELRFQRVGESRSDDAKEQWRAEYPGGYCQLQTVDGGWEGTWHEGQRSGRVRFTPTRLGRHLQGTYSRGDGPLQLSWPAW
ncbi:MAG TPA: alkaline phosphatase D family protein [Pirellulaceae bacterium]|nr:alkaline phosphatase D family protein [Pirellulaceae bacterium]